MLQKANSSDIMSCSSNASILSQQSSQRSPSSISSISSSSIQPKASITTSSLIAEKNECEQLLNIAMTTLHQKFGQNNDPKIMSIIHKKINELKQLVSIIENQAKQKHIDIDKKLDEAHRLLQCQTKKQHQRLEEHKEEQLMTIYTQFDQWVDAKEFNNNNNNNNNHNHNNNHHNNNNHGHIQQQQQHNNNQPQQHHPSQLVINGINANQIIQQNQNGNLIIITDGNNAVVKAFIIQQQQNQNRNQNRNPNQNQNQNPNQNRMNNPIPRPSNVPQLK